MSSLCCPTTNPAKICQRGGVPMLLFAALLAGMLPERSDAQTCAKAATNLALDNMEQNALNLLQTKMSVIKSSDQQESVIAEEALDDSDPLRPANFCAGSRKQLCRKKCPKSYCRSGQCMMRLDSCCSMACMDMNDVGKGKLPGVEAKFYFDYLGKTIPTDEELEQMEPSKAPPTAKTINFPESTESWKGLGEGSHNTFAAQFQGFIKITKTSKYQFRLNSDDGSRMYLSGKLIIDNGGLHDMETKESKELKMKDGWHSFRIVYFERQSPHGLILQYKEVKKDCPEVRPHQYSIPCKWSTVPASMLFHKGGAGSEQTATRRRPRMVAGRPFTTPSGSLLAPANVRKQNIDDSWYTPARSELTDWVPEGWTSDMASSTADAWLRDGQEEHASIASFSRFSLDLMRFAAPSELVTAAHIAAVDEVRHAKKAFGLSAHFHGKEAVGVEVSPFPAAVVELSPSLDDLAMRALEEGCVGESTAVARLAYTLHVAHASSPARSTMEELLTEEAQHAALAWATVQWAVRRGAVVQRREASPALELSAQAESPLPLTLVWGGQVPLTTEAKISAMVAQAWSGPWAQAVSRGDAVLPPVSNMSADDPVAQAVNEAAQLVRQHLEKFEAHTVLV
eukprot:gnl/TRDRNA2_/TRDRNA2_150817_c0_seq1.p1 gnl/TRDRNA2_/TRDRNA2_150817_c0~~gnl/TRDRNA2_/TRDRNA2_150817_c0_seq1.p1  ORF type:complete len:624 (-),score=108.30 gnl/TRDRNA2_/TRDRNA2_150817_c0_seq1:99-1970(-)